MKNERLMNDVIKSLLLAALVAVGLPELAWAQAAGGTATGTDLGEVTTVLDKGSGLIAPLVSTLFWVAGGVLMGAGALKLKEHAENPTQTPMRQGISRMAVGASLITIPFFSQFITNTLGNNAGAAQYNAFGT